MNHNNGYIYIRNHESYEKYSAYKIGKTCNIPDRNNGYITNEIKRGNFEAIFEVLYDDMTDIENLIKKEFNSINIRINGATEFFEKNIIELIEPLLIIKKYKYKKLNKQEILNLSRSKRFKIISQKIKNNIIEKKQNIIKPLKHHDDVLNCIEDYYYHNNIGKIIWACGLGKTFMALFIIKKLNFKINLIGVPSKNLQKQWKDNILKIYPNKKNILFVGGDYSNIITDFPNKEFINNEPIFVISTYHSCNTLVNIKFDFKVGDEAHHLVGIEKESNKCFLEFHKIHSKKTLFITATEKIIETELNKSSYSMDDENIFGKYIDIKTVNWAIENKKITDYNILVIKNTEDDVNAIISNLKINVKDKNIFIACYMCLKSLDKNIGLTHILLYTNTTQEAEQAKKYIEELLSLKIISISKEKIYNDALHSNNSKSLVGEIDKFKSSSYGIISCVYIFGEGFDLPKLNGVCIASNMTSNIRIVQYVLRPNRLEKTNPLKIATIIIPSIDNTTNNKSFENVKNVIYQLRNVDQNIEQKIKVLEYNNKRPGNNQKDSDFNDFEENEIELTKLKMRLRYSKTLTSNFTEEQDEYNYVRSINISLNIQSDRDYFENKYMHSNFIENPEEYFKLKGVWNNWYDFYGIDTSKFIKSKEDWNSFCKEKNMKSLENYYKFCELYNELPKNPAYFYKDFTNIPNELGFNNIRRL